MAVKIRLTRRGAKKRPFYRMVVADCRAPRDGRVIDTIGFYDPISKTEPYRIDGEKAVHWLSEGAEPTDTARSLLRKAGIMKAWKEGVAPEIRAEPEAASEDSPADPEPEPEPETKGQADSE